MKRVSIVTVIFIAVTIAEASDKSETGKIRGPSPSAVSIPNRTQSKEQNSSQKSGKTLQNTVEASQVRRHYIIPILNEIFATPMNCQKLLDNEKAFEELKAIYRRNEPLEKFIDPSMKDLHSEDLLSRISPELESNIQKNTQGHIVFHYPNYSTIRELTDIWKRYPCSEAGAVALLKIGNVIYQPSSLSMVEINGMIIGSFDNEAMILDKYISDNYKNTWEGELALMRYSIKAFKPSSQELINAKEREIQYFEVNRVLFNRYYIYFSEASDPIRNFIQFDYFSLARDYSDKCQSYAEGSDLERNKIFSEAIEMYSKHYELWEHAKIKYPEYYKEIDSLERWGTDNCYGYIEKYAPDKVRHQPRAQSPAP